MDRALQLRPKRASRNDAEASAERRSAADEQEDRALLCRSCGSEVAEQHALFCMRAESAVQVFPNPYGQMRVILTLTRARSVDVIGPPTTEFTWFAGYAWRIVACAACRAHLGWSFEAAEAIGPGEPALFYGLLREALVEG